MNTEKRLSYVDIAKGMGIILVIIGHTVNCRLNVFISAFHMPFFFFITGYTLNINKKISQSVINDAKRLLIPCYIAYGIQCFIHAQRNSMNLFHFVKMYITGIMWGGVSETEVLGIDVVGLWAFWFLVVMFWGRNLYRVLCIKIKRYRIIFIYFLSCIGLYIGTSTHFQLPQCFDLILVSLIYIEVGNIYRNSNLDYNKELILSTVCMSLYLLNTWDNQTNISMAGRYYPTLYSALIIPCLASIAFLALAKSFEQLKCLHLLEYLGKNTLALLCIHGLDRNLEQLWMIGDNHWIWFILRVILDFSLLFIVSSTYKIWKNKYFERTLLRVRKPPKW